MKKKYREIEEWHRWYADCKGCKDFIQKFENIVKKLIIYGDASFSQ